MGGEGVELRSSGLDPSLTSIDEERIALPLLKASSPPLLPLFVEPDVGCGLVVRHGAMGEAVEEPELERVVVPGRGGDGEADSRRDVYVRSWTSETVGERETHRCA